MGGATPSRLQPAHTQRGLSTIPAYNQSPPETTGVKPVFKTRLQSAYNPYDYTLYRELRARETPGMAYVEGGLVYLIHRIGLPGD